MVEVTSPKRAGRAHPLPPSSDSGTPLSGPGRGHLPGHPSQIPVVTIGPGLQCVRERHEPLADSDRGELRRGGDRAVRQLQPARLAGPDMDRGQHDGGQGAGTLADALPPAHRRHGERLCRV